MYKTQNLAEIPSNFLLYIHNLSRHQTRFRFLNKILFSSTLCGALCKAIEYTTSAIYITLTLSRIVNFVDYRWRILP